jgi:hypothetical protein
VTLAATIFYLEDDPLQVLLAARAEHDLRPTLRKQLRGGLTEAAAAAGYDHCLAVYSIHVLKPSQYEIVQRHFQNLLPRI